MRLRRVLIGLFLLGASHAAGAQQGPQPLTLDREVQGSLAEGDEQLSSGEYKDAWTFSARRGERFVITMRSTEFDPYLLVRGPGGLSEDNDDDPEGGGSLDSRLEFTAAADGIIQVGATSYQPGETGRYRIVLQRDDSLPTPPTIVAQNEPPRLAEQAQQPAMLTLGGSVAGTLLPNDRQRPSGKYEDVFTFAGRRGQAVDLRLSSGDFDPYLVVSGPGGFSAFNDDENPQTLNSRLAFTLPADGTYRVAATSYRSGELGAYQISVVPAPAGTRAFVPEPAEPLRIGSQVRGALNRQDAQVEDKFVDRYRFAGRRGQRVRLAAQSTDFDTYLVLVRPDGSRMENDDSNDENGESTLNSRIDTVLPEDGDYTVWVTSYAEGDGGDYELSLAPTNGTPRQAAVQGGQRVFAVMVGVSDYGGRTSDLALTDEDATRLFESLREAGVLHPASTVLTNEQATRQAVEAAFARVARQAGPDDLFLFFFSGHGDQVPASSGAREMDGMTETLELRDAALTDRDMVRMFDQVRARMALLIVDSCFSGGFEEVVNRPNVMALLSSEEDLTSEVAGRLGSGGYLSHFVRAGLSGDGDIDGDRMITAGEIATYLRRQFRGQGEIEALTVDRLQRNQQNFVIRRGGVQVDDVLVRLTPAALAAAQ